MEKQENLHKELDLIQGVITRMSNNAFLVKGWNVTLISAIVVFGKDFIMSETKGIYYLLLLLIVVIPFWWLDAFFLRQERLFRHIYQKAVTDPEALNRTRYSLNPQEANTQVKNIWRLMVSQYLVWFYLPIIVLVLLLIILKMGKVY